MNDNICICGHGAEEHTSWERKRCTICVACLDFKSRGGNGTNTNNDKKKNAKVSNL